MAEQTEIAPAADASGEASEATAKVVTYWRPARAQTKGGKRGAGQKGQNRNRGAKDKTTEARAAAKTGGKSGGTGRQKQAAKQADPNSPFAVLKNLQSGSDD